MDTRLQLKVRIWSHKHPRVWSQVGVCLCVCSSDLQLVGFHRTDSWFCMCWGYPKRYSKGKASTHLFRNLQNKAKHPNSKEWNGLGGLAEDKEPGTGGIPISGGWFCQPTPRMIKFCIIKIQTQIPRLKVHLESFNPRREVSNLSSNPEFLLKMIPKTSYFVFYLGFNVN